MIRDLLKWLACGFVVVLGLALLNWGPAGVRTGNAQAERESPPAFAVAGGESPVAAGERAQP